MDFENIVPAVERILLISWLLKDFGWMCTDIYLGWPFGFTAIFYHLVLLIFDPRSSFRFYNFSILLWVTGNLLWMSIEFISTTNSSNVHFGPHVPLSSMSKEMEDSITNTKIALFSVSLFTQFVMYVGICCGYVEMPRHLSEEPSAEYELSLLLGRRMITSTSNNVARVVSQSAPSTRSADTTKHGISTAFVEYMYIALWISKDLLWSYGTGDIEIDNRPLAIFLETMGLFCGVLAMGCYIITAYLYRRSRICFLDCITTIFWISANFVWMSGEFFERYNNLQLDDLDSGNDSNTRIIAATFFMCGIAIQVYILLYLSLGAICVRQQKSRRIPRFELVNFPSHLRKKTTSLFSAYSPQKLVNHEESDDDEIVLF